MMDYSFLISVAIITSVLVNPSLCGVSVDPLVTDLVYLDIDIDGREVGRIVIGLFGGTTPKTVQNFISLAKHEYGYGYRKSLFHRIIPNFMMQGGDFTNADGTGGYSIYGPLFKDENFIHRHYGAGWVCMANAGTDTNGSQFYITFIKTPWIDGSHTCFGKVVSGMNVVRECEAVVTNDQDRPVVPVEIYDSGILHLRKSYLVKLSDALVDKNELDDDYVDITEYDESEYKDDSVEYDTDEYDSDSARLTDEL